MNDCTTAPAPGNETSILADTLLDRVERLIDHHGHIADHHHHHPPHYHSLKLRRERSCHDIPLKDTSAMFSLQRRVRVLRDQLQKKDLQIELLKRKMALIEDGARGKCLVQVKLSIFISNWDCINNNCVNDCCVIHNRPSVMRLYAEPNEHRNKPIKPANN